MAINVNVPSQVPPIGNKFLEQQLANQAAARANAQAELPANMQSTGTPFQGGVPPVPNMPTEEEYQSFAAPSYVPPEVEPQPFNDVVDVERETLTAVGEATPYDVRVQQLEAEKEKQAKLAQSVNIDWESQEELRNAFPESVLPTQAGTIQRAARDVGESLSRSMVSLTEEGSATPVDLSGMMYLKQGLGLNTRQVASNITLAANMIAPMLAGAAKTGNGEIQTDEKDTFDYLDSILSQEGDVAIPKSAVNGGVPLDVVEQTLGRLVKSYAKGSQVDETNNPLDPRTMQGQNVDAQSAGATAVNALVEADIFTLDNAPDGTRIVRLNPIFGTEFYANGRNLRRTLGEAGAGMSQTVPVTEEGNYAGAMRNIRRGDKQKVNFEKLDNVTEAKRIAGSIGRLVGPGKAYIGALLYGNALIEAQNNPQNPAPFNTLGLFKITKQDVEQGSPVVKDKLNNLGKELTMLANALAQGSPRYTPHWEDYSVHRLYNDTLDFNEQRNKFTRGITNGIGNPFMMDSNYHETGVNRFTAEKYWERVGNKARSGNFDVGSLSSQERELGFLMTLGRVLDVGRTVGMTTENMTAPGILEAVTPKFIIEAAQVGALLKSIVPSTKRDVYNAMIEPQKIDPSKLTNEQKVALQTLLDNSDRETWGYVLQAYVDASNYLDAKKNNKPFLPKATVAIDMNSAGRAFLAMDIGEMNVIERVGLLWESADRDGVFDDTQPEGNPRTYFVDVAKKQSIDKAFGLDQRDKALKFKELLNKYESRAFNKSLAKKVLLTTDYGKPLAYHLEEARAFLKDYPDFTNELVEYYNGDTEAAIKDINEIFKFTLKDVVSEWQFVLPKKMVKVLQMLGRVPHPEGMYGEKMSLGNMSPVETGTTVTIGSGANERKVKLTRAMFNPLAAAKPKTFEDGTVWEPGEGTAAINQIGPLLGQYRESALVIDTMNYINGGKDPAKMMYMLPVFDNFITDASSYPYVLYTANNIIAPKVFEWDIQKPFKEDFEKQLRDAFADIQKQGEVVIDSRSPYRGLFITLDREYGYIKDSKNLSQAQKEFKEVLDNPKSGYVQPSERSGATVLTPAQVTLLVKAAVVYFDISGQRSAKSNNEGGLNSWINRGLEKKRKAMDKVKQKAKQGMIYFMT
jgi:hypothetical protein